MKFSRAFIKAALAGDKRKCEELKPVIHKCAKAGCSKARVPGHIDDIEQELWIFLDRKVDQLDEQYNIEPYLIQTAYMMARAFNRKFGSFGTDGDDARVEGLAGLSGSEVSSHEEASDSLVVAADQEAAMKALLKSSPALRKASNQEAENTMQTHSTKNSPPGVEALRRLRERAGLTQNEMATKLGLKLPTYQAYEYGRTKKGVPKQVMAVAKNLTIDPEYSYAIALYGGRPMRDIAQEWARRMGVNENSPAEIAAALGINKSNTSRWLNKAANVRLSPEELIKYERRVAAEERYFQASQKRHRAMAG
jgi:transcriptional regulator with XRE-family HTH domain